MDKTLSNFNRTGHLINHCQNTLNHQTTKPPSSIKRSDAFELCLYTGSYEGWCGWQCTIPGFRRPLAGPDIESRNHPLRGH